MARIAGINIPPHQHAEIGLTAIFGIGRTRARKICEATGIPYAKKVKDLTELVDAVGPWAAFASAAGAAVVAAIVSLPLRRSHAAPAE